MQDACLNIPSHVARPRTQFHRATAYSTGPAAPDIGIITRLDAQNIPHYRSLTFGGFG